MKKMRIEHNYRVTLPKVSSNQNATTPKVPRNMYALFPWNLHYTWLCFLYQRSFFLIPFPCVHAVLSTLWQIKNFWNIHKRMVQPHEYAHSKSFRGSFSFMWKHSKLMGKRYKRINLIWPNTKLNGKQVVKSSSKDFSYSEENLQVWRNILLILCVGFQISLQWYQNRRYVAKRFTETKNPCWFAGAETL